MKIKQFIVTPESKESIIIPKNSIILSVAPYNDNHVCVYVLCTDNEPITREIFCVRTGKNIDKEISKYYYIGMVTIFKGLYTFHVFINLNEE